MLSWDDPSAEHYMRIADEFVAKTQAICMKKSGNLEHLETILDFACGYGRITRILATRFPHATRIAASDIDAEAVAWCSRQFDVQGIVSSQDPTEVGLDDVNDLILCVSLFTHLPVKSWKPWLAKLGGALSKDGLLVMTIQAPERLAQTSRFGIASEALPPVQEQLDRTGIGFLAGPSCGATFSPAKEEYGMTFVSDQYIHNCAAEVGLKVFTRLPCGLDNFQDIYAFDKSD